MDRPVILCVDDEKSILDTLTTQMDSHLGDDYEYEMANSGEEALELVKELQADGLDVAVIVSDQLMPGMKGDELLVEIHNISPQTNKILLTGQASADAVGNALNKAKLYRYVAKPWDKTDLMLTIEEAAKSYMQGRQLSLQNQMLEALFYASTSLSKETQLNRLLPRLAEILMDNTGAQRGTVLLVEDDKIYPSPCLKLAWNDFGGKEFVPDHTNGFAFSIVTKVLENRRRYLVQNCMSEPWGADPHIQEQEPRSIFAAPLLVDDKLVGVMYLENYERFDGFDHQAEEFVQLFSIEASISIEKAQLYENLENKVEERTRTITQQKNIIEEKNQDITDSMQYASRIQHAILPDQARLTKWLPDSFILYAAKDIVSGDFYWFTHESGTLYFAAADCTGHGVPGAMLSVLGSNTLFNIVAEQNKPAVEEILSLLHLKISSNLKTGDEQALDGMDIALCALDLDSRRLHFAGANRPLYLYRNNGELEEIKGDRAAIGGHTPADFAFARHTIQLTEGDSFFIFSDGITDQFGGPDARKYSPRRLREIIQANAGRPAAEVGAAVEKSYLEWKGAREQTDDIIVIGARV